MPVDISVVIPNFNGRDFLDDCIESLMAQDYPKEKIEIVLVDNASTDTSVGYVGEKWPAVKIVELKKNLGFAGGVNAGVKEANGKYVALINNDAKADPKWITNGLAAFSNSMDVAMVGSKIVSYDGELIDYAGGALSFYGHGFKIGVNEKDKGQHDAGGDTLFASGCALFMPRNLFLDVGGFDESYFAFFEDVDLGWRLWIMGYRVLYEPSSLVYHRHHSTVEKLGDGKERFLLERNALMTIIKNYDDENLNKLVWPSLMLSLERGLALFDVDREKYDLAFGSHRGLAPETVPPQTVSHLLAVSDVSRNMPAIMQRRHEVQSRRKQPDKKVHALFVRPTLSQFGQPEYMKTFNGMLQATGVEEVFKAATNVLIITADTVSAKMAGPAIRAWEMSTELGRKHNVVMLAKAFTGVTPKNFRLEELSKETLSGHLRWADVIVFQGFIMHIYPSIADAGKVLVADLYDPFHLENLEMFRDDVSDRRINVASADLEIINKQLRVCDFFICASEKQRDFWLGQLAGVGRLNPWVYDMDPTLRKLIDVVPFGITSEPITHTKDAIKGVIPGIEKADKVILWGGGIYNWFDPLTLIKAIDILGADHPEIKLFFMGLKHPNPDVPQMRMATEAIALSQELGLENKRVFFNHGWVPYEERANYLLEADIGVSCHLEHIETSFSYRTRVLDYFWAELPVIVTRGDALSQLVEERSLGLTVEPGDIEGFAMAIRKMVEDEELVRMSKLNIAKLRPELAWSQILEPLSRFCTAPRRAPDNLNLLASRHSRQDAVSRFGGAVASAWRQGGVGLVTSRTKRYISNRIKQNP